MNLQMDVGKHEQSTGILHFQIGECIEFDAAEMFNFPYTSTKLLTCPGLENVLLKFRTFSRFS